MIKKVERNYLEINSLENLRESKSPLDLFSIKIANPSDFQLNKFFYKNIGKNCEWTDRLIWSDQNWINYISKKNLFTYVLKNKDEIAGYFELLVYQNTKESEIAYLGILEEYFGKKLGGYLLSEAIKNSFSLGCSRVWVHTCSLDHKNALNNYLSRGMKIFKSETLTR